MIQTSQDISLIGGEVTASAGVNAAGDVVRLRFEDPEENTISLYLLTADALRLALSIVDGLRERPIDVTPTREEVKE